MKLRTMTFTMTLGALVLASCNKEEEKRQEISMQQRSYAHVMPRNSKGALVFSGKGDIYPVIGSFIDTLGHPLNTTPNGFPGGFRFVSWSHFPMPFGSTGDFPGDFFNSTDPQAFNSRKRGILFNTPGTGLRVSEEHFEEIDPSYYFQFVPFFGTRVFSPMGSNVLEITFRVPGTETEAYVQGLGMVFIDVDNGSSTTVEYFSGNESLGVYMPLPGNPSGHSFLGVYYPERKITKVRITNGNGILAAGNKDISDGSGRDLVVLDNIYYDEPLALEP